MGVHCHQSGAKMYLEAILVLFSLLGVNTQQDCNRYEGEPGLGLQVAHTHSGPLTLKCWYTGPRFFSCNGTCDSGTFLGHPHTLVSNHQSCVCCEAETVVEWDPSYYCEITNNNGINVWQQRDIIGPYYEYRNCHCASQDQSSRNKRQVNEDGTVGEGVENVSECREERNTIFSSPCNPRGLVTICRSNQRLVLKQAEEQNILTNLSTAVDSGSVTDDFFPVHPDDVEYKSIIPPEPWVLPREIFWEIPEECKEFPTSSVILFSIAGGLIIILILILIVCVVCKHKENGDHGEGHSKSKRGVISGPTNGPWSNKNF